MGGDGRSLAHLYYRNPNLNQSLYWLVHLLMNDDVVEHGKIQVFQSLKLLEELHALGEPNLDAWECI
jgi:hypothetical protein